MITNLFIAYVVFTNTFATNISDTVRFDTLYRTIISSMVIEGETCPNTNRFEIGRRWMQLQTNYVEQPNGLFQKVVGWFEMPKVDLMKLPNMPPPLPPPPPLPGGVSTNIPSAVYFPVPV